jgi:3-oxoacyl-(acyl-carrier-protein) synthase
VIRDGRTSGMISGGVDSLEETFFKVHDRFRALSPMRLRTDSSRGELARPFDRRHNGPILGEGGFLLLLEAASAAEARGARVYGEVLGVGAAASKTALNEWPSEPTGIVRAMRQALSDAALSRDEIGAVMSAANGAPQLDRIEAAALREVFGDCPVAVASVKGALGECGASGASAVIAGLLSISRGLLVPTAGFEEPDPSWLTGLRVSGSGQTVASNTFLVNSTASGGTHYTLAVRAERPRP